MADDEHRLLREIELAHETLHFFVHAQVIRRHAARDQDRIEVVGGHIRNDLFGFHTLAFVEPLFATDLLERTIVDADDRYDRSGFFKRTLGIQQFRLFKSITDQRGDALSFDFHTCLISPDPRPGTWEPELQVTAG